MIEHADPRDGRYTTLIAKLNEVIDAVNALAEIIAKDKLNEINDAEDQL